MRNMMLFVGLVLLLAVVSTLLQAGEAANERKWNENVSSKVLSAEVLASYGESLPEWRIKQMIWPPVADLEASKVEAPERRKDRCVRDIGRLLKPEYIPAGLKDHLVAMNNWGNIEKPEEQKQGVDAFIVRYELDGCIIHIQNSPSHFMMTIVDKDLSARFAKDHAELVEETRRKFVGPEVTLTPIHPASQGDSVSVSGFRFKYETSAGVDSDRPADLQSAFTDGNFVQLCFFKFPGGPKADFDPYQQWFDKKEAANARKWNENVSSKVLTTKTLASYGESLPEWRIKQMTWPSVAELEASKVEAPERWKDRCVGDIGRLLKPEHVPAGLKDHLVAMNNWGNIEKPEEQKQGVDAFIVRYELDGCIIHIQNSPSHFLMTIVDKDLSARFAKDHAELVEETRRKFVGPEVTLAPIHPASQGDSVSGFRFQYETRAGVDSDRPADLQFAFTDGNFVQLCFRKIPDGPRVFFDPYQQWFDKKEAANARKWNENVSSKVLSAKVLASYGESLPEWRRSQMIWPSKVEVDASSVKASPDRKAACVKVIGEILNPSHIPADVEDHVVAMNNWARIYPPENQKKLVDAFIARYKIGDSVIHIQDSPRITTIAICDESLAESADGDRAKLFRDIWEKFIRSDLKSSWPAKTRSDATPEVSVFAFYTGTRKASAGEAPFMGAAFTDGRFVLLEFKKDDRSPVGIDPYKELF